MLINVDVDQLLQDPLKQICEFKAKLGSLIILEFKAAEALNS